MCDFSQTIGDLVKQKKTPRLQGSATVAEALDMLEAYGCGIIAVECEDEFVGVFSHGDFQKSVIRQNLRPEETTLYEIILLNPPYVTADLTVKETYNAMLAYQWKYMPVLCGKHLCGIISLHDLARTIMQAYEKSEQANRLIINYARRGEFYALTDYEE